MSEGRDGREELQTRRDGQLRYFVDALEGGDAWRVRGTEPACFKLKVADGRERGRCRYRGAARICLWRRLIGLRRCESAKEHRSEDADGELQRSSHEDATLADFRL